MDNEIKNTIMKNFIEAIIKIDNEIYNTIKYKLLNNKPLTLPERKYILFFMDKIRERGKNE